MTNPRPDETQLPSYYQSEAYISHSNKSGNLIGQVYKISRTFTLKWKLNLLKKYAAKNPETVLDYGCGTGDFLGQCQRHHLKITGVEPSIVAREQATKNTGARIYSDLEKVTETFSAITLWHVLEHVDDLHKTISSLKGHLEENGTMFIAVPNLLSLDARTYGKFWAGYDVPRHLWHFSRETLEKVLSRHHLKLVNIIPMLLDSYYVSLLSEKYKNGNNGVSSITNALIQGWKSNNAAKTTQEYSSLIYIVRK